MTDSHEDEPAVTDDVRGVFDDDESDTTLPDTPDSNAATEGDEERVTGDLPASQPFTHP